jgi:MoaA/NifB/PqqE/SkfB family radical SAM enzyme
MIDFTDLHVGLTNRCRLLCPECTRTQLDNRYIQNMFDLDTDYFKNFLLDCNPNRILFCGNWGDPIYSKDFVGLVRAIKTQNPSCELEIQTNGSGKSIKFWTNLATELLDNDVLIFSIDGSPENYNKYRVNSEWADVELAVKTVIETKKQLGKKTSIEWKHLVFSYNEETIDIAHAKSIELGFDKFFLQQSMVANEKWLSITRPFREIERDFYDRKDKRLL